MDIKVNFSGRAIKYTEDEIAVVVEAMRNAEPLTQGKPSRRRSASTSGPSIALR